MRTLSSVGVPFCDEPEGGVDGIRSMVGMVTLFSGKTRTRLSQNTVVGHPVHVFFNFDPSFVKYCVRKGLTCVGFLPVAMEATTDPTQDDEE